MAINVITAANSLTVQLVDNDAEAFLLVKADGSIVTNGSDGSAYFSTGGSQSVTVAGSLISDQFNGAYLDGGGARVVVGSSGIVSGGKDGLQVLGGGGSVTNAGLIVGRSTYLTDTESSGVYFAGSANKLSNTGTITGYRALAGDDGAVDIVNSGTIISTGVYAFLSSGSVSIDNSGHFSGDVDAKYVSLQNSGSISGTVAVTTQGYLVIYNTGSITENVGGNSFSDLLNNDGSVGGVYLNDGNDQLINSGHILRDVYLGGYSTGSTDNDTFTNTGRVDGLVDAGDGIDTIDSSGGVILGMVYLQNGTDSYLGGDARDRVDGGTGNDSVDLAGGNDVYFAANGDGSDQVDGGDGIDRYDASGATQACIVDLSAGTTSGPLGNDLVLNFENITGGSAADTLTGDDGANRIDGGMGADKLDGGAGNDRLIGGTGTDTITGGVGRDIMTGGQLGGGLDSDTFVFRASDSGTTAATRDRITDFTDHGSNTSPFATGADTIDLHLIDANTGTTGDQAFSFNATAGAAFSGTAGSLIWQQYNGFALISGDTNGDKVADFTIQLNGTHTLFASDFVL